jgi:predicted dehydrogenase
MATKYNIPNVYTDYRILIEKGNLDAIVVATPDDLHYQMTMDALDANLHVLCEKPLALNAKQAREMYQKAEEKQVKHMVLFTWRWQPHFRFLKQLVDEGYIGQCYHADFYFFGGFGLEPVYRWRSDGRRSNGVISDLGAHMIDFARWYVGEIVKVSAQLGTFVDRPSNDDKPLIPTNDLGSVFLQFDNGAQGVIRVSAVANRGDRGVDMSVRLYGDSGTLEVDQIFFGPEAGAKVRGVLEDEGQFKELEVPSVFYEAMDKSEIFDPYYKQSVGPRLFVEAIVEDKQIKPNFYEGFKVQEVIDSILESNREGCWVSLE